MSIVNVWDKVAKNFGKVGPKYWNEFGLELINFSQIESGTKVLDIGMGRGASLFPAIKNVGDNGEVIGIDSSVEMVKYTRNAIRRKGIKSAKVLNISVEEMNFPNNYFNYIVCGFGLSYIVTADENLNKINAILKEGGQVSFSVWGEQKDQEWLTKIVEKYLETNKKNLESKYSMDNSDDLMLFMYKNKFVDIEIYEKQYLVVYGDKVDWFEEMNNNAVRDIFDKIRELGNDVFAKFKEDIFKGLDEFLIEGTYCFNMPVIYISAKKSS